MSNDTSLGPDADGTFVIDVLPGDGIGPELIASALEVLRAALASDGVELITTEVAAGAAEFQRTGRPISGHALERLRTSTCTLKGPVGLPEVRHPDGTEAGLLGGVLRTGLDTYANVRPARSRPGVLGVRRADAPPIDLVIVRENTEGLYLSRGRGVRTRDAAADQMLLTRAGVERISRYALDLARRRNGKRRVTCVDKSNVLTSFAFFREVFTEVAHDYPDVEVEYRYADAAAHDLVLVPERFDVLVMENFLGDILSDLAAATVGGLGLCPAANLGDGAAYFEPVHGSAPALAGTDRANPLSQILSGSMLLEHNGFGHVAQRIECAVDDSLRAGDIVINAMGSPVSGTRATTAALVARLG